MTTKLRSVFQILTLAAAGSVLFCQSADASSGTPPDNRTGAPGHGSCASCHGGAGSGSIGDKRDFKQVRQVFALQHCDHQFAHGIRFDTLR